ncbi:MAG: C25 family cysteine peptidase [bacterium]
MMNHQRVKGYIYLSLRVTIVFCLFHACLWIISFPLTCKGAEAQVLNSGWKNPANTGGGWTSPTNAYSSNNSYAECSFLSPPLQDWYDFDFKLSDNSIIRGIAVRLEGKDNNTDSGCSIKLSWDGGVHYTAINVKDTVWPDVDNNTYKNFGGEMDTWGRSWSATEFAPVNFRIELKYEGGFGSSFSLDHLQVKVYYEIQPVESTAVTLLSFSASGHDSWIRIEWETAQEISNMGFYLYRAQSVDGPFVKCTNKLIPGSHMSMRAQYYYYDDSSVRQGNRYYYKVEDIDLWGKRTAHGPISIDWQGSSIPDVHTINRRKDKGKIAIQVNRPLVGKIITRAPFRHTASESTDNQPYMREPPCPAPAYKLVLSGEGIYRLSKEEFEKYGLTVDEIDLSTVRLSHLGKEIAIHIEDKNENNRLDSEDFIEFYACEVQKPYKKYTKYNVYWLILRGGSGNPQRMATVDGTPQNEFAIITQRAHIHYEEDEYYMESIPGEDSLDRWILSPCAVGKDVDLPRAGEPVSFPFSVPPGIEKGRMILSILGTCSSNHEAELLLNGKSLGIATWRGNTLYQISVNDIELLSGNNILAIRCCNGVDSIGLDWFTIEYPQMLRASEGQLKQSDCMLFDITSTIHAARIINFQNKGNGPYRVDCEPHDGPGACGVRTYLALTSEQVRIPLSLSKTTSFNLTKKENGADYIIITPSDLGWDKNGILYPWLHDLLCLRERQGLRTKVVPVEEIYNEFSFGLATPEAIREFLIYACRNWATPSPQYVVLVGDSSYDYKNNWRLEEGNYTYLPTYLIFTPYMGETATDEWFVKIKDDIPAPPPCIGRIPAASVKEAAVMIRKILNYERIPNTSTWEKNILLCADNITKPYEMIFEIMSNEAAAFIPSDMNPPFKGYLSNFPNDTVLASTIREKINKGCLLVSYSGHGSGQIWAKEQIFNQETIEYLANEPKFPFFISMSCLAGYFINPESLGFSCMAEMLLRSEGKGAVAALMPTGKTTPASQYILHNALFQALFAGDIRTLGPAIAYAKEVLLAKGKDIERAHETFLLFGDPAMKLKIPLPRKVLTSAND